MKWACVSAALAWRAAAFDAAEYQFQRRVMPAGARGEFAAVTLDAEVYAVARGDLHDLRLVDTAGTVQPHHIVRGMTPREYMARRPQPHRIAHVVETASNTLEVVLELTGEHTAANGVTIHTPLKDFERTVTVYGSDDGQAWTLLLAQALIFDYTRFMDVHNHDIRLPAQTRAAWLKLVISGVTDEQAASLQRVTRSAQQAAVWAEERAAIARRPLRIEQLEVWRDERVTERGACDSMAYPLAAYRVSNDTARQTTWVEFSVRRVPLTQIIFDIADKNFSRRATVYARMADDAWVAIHHATLTRLHLTGYHHERLALDLPEQRHDWYRVEIENGDSLALDVRGVQVRGPVYRLTWMPQAETPYLLYLGNAQARAPRYDLAALVAAEERQLPHAAWHFGPLETNPAAARLAARKAASATYSRYIAGAAIVAMIAALALAIWHASRRVDAVHHTH